MPSLALPDKVFLSFMLPVGSIQTVDVNFDITVKPTLLSVGDVFLLPPGQWNVSISGKPGKFMTFC